MASPSLDRQTILQAVRRWPREEQTSLARAILEQAELEQAGEVFYEDPVDPPNPRGFAGLLANGKTPPTRSWRNLIGILATDEPAPTDEEIERWLDEHKMEK